MNERTDSDVPAVFWHETATGPVALIAAADCECGGHGFVAFGAVTRDGLGRYVWVDLVDHEHGTPVGGERKRAEDAAEDLLDHVGVFRFLDDPPAAWCQADPQVVDSHLATMAEACVRLRDIRILESIPTAEASA